MPDPTPAPIVFCDVETTGLAGDDEIWEFAAVRRDPDGTETELHLFIEHDETKCARLPQEFRADHAARFPSACSGRVHTRTDAARDIVHFFRVAYGAPQPVVVGINPGFDLDRISRLIATHRPVADAAPWHYTPIDARHLGVGVLLAGGWLLPPPWGSEDVSRMLRIEPDDFARHTAVGDVQWAMAIYDAALPARTEAGR